jgi:exopolyphosphatase/guanosine-5'-triphosphate,3'-diphosphate pyrophosphatase
VRLVIARPSADGSLEVLHEERDPVRPGEGVFRSGSIPREVERRLFTTLRRYQALCARYHAKVRAVATSAIREARNGKQVAERVRREVGLDLEVVSGREEARLICLGVLQGRAPSTKSLVVDVGGGSTEIATAVGERPVGLHSVAIGAVRVSELFSSEGAVGPKKLQLMRSFAAEAFREALPKRFPHPTRTALGSSGTIGAVVRFAAGGEGRALASARQITRSVDELAAMSPSERRARFDARRAEIIVGGAVVVEALVLHLGIKELVAVERGLRNGLLVEAARRRSQVAPAGEDAQLADAALTMGRRLRFDEAHATQVARIALSLFDDLAPLHRLPASARPMLEVAALLHDVGHAVSYQRHHKHTYYLVLNADLPGLTDRSRDLVARVARYHRRSPPERSHSGMLGLRESEVALVRKLATLLRLADALDRSHLHPVQALRARDHGDAVVLTLVAKGGLDLELWDAQHELPLFRRVFGRRLEIVTRRRSGR